jgi:hypothetical protein
MAWNRHAIALTQLRKHVAPMAWGARSLISTQQKAVERAIIQSRIIAPLEHELHVPRDVVLLRSRLERAPEPLDLPVEALIEVDLELTHEVGAGDLRERPSHDIASMASRTPLPHLVDVLAFTLQL